MKKHKPELNAARAPLTRLERGLPAGWYREPVHHARELEAFWYDHWIAVARDEELPTAGDYRVVAIGTQSVLLTRDADGKVHGFHNTCRHRGSILCSEDHGNFTHQRITCPYHSWTYDLQGQLQATPRRMPTPDFDAKNFSLFKVNVDSWGGFLFVHLGAKPPPLQKTLGDLPQRFRNYGFENLRIGKRIVSEVKANWKLIAENFSECFHCPPVHPEFCRVVTSFREAGAWGLRAGTESLPEYKPGAKTLTPDGSARIPPFRGLNQAEREALYVPWLAPPNLFLNVHPDYINAHMMFPTGPETVRIVYDWLFEPDHMPLGADLDHYVALWDTTNQQDARNCEWQQQGMQSLQFKNGVFVPQEFDCHRFCEWVRTGLRTRTSKR
ncbi:MAG: aromatic ring-hydroxylating oxygenase subunit alpha [Burkholderiales bacterium]